MSRPCPNCSAVVTTPWCGQCGQQATHGRLDLHTLAHDAWHAILHLDGGIVRVLRGLATRPGRVYAEYLAGARKRYFNPVLFLLLVEGAYIAVGGGALRRYTAVVGQSSQAMAEAVVLQGDKYRALLALPVLILVGWGVSRPRYTVAEVGVFWCFAMGMATLADGLTLPLQWAWPLQRDAFQYAGGVAAAVVLLWHVAAFFGGRSLAAVAQAAGITAVAMVALNYAERIIYRWNDFDVTLALVPTLRDTFGL